MHFQNIDFDIDIEIFGNFDIDIGIDIEKNGGNIENLSSENEASSSPALSFLLDFLFFPPKVLRLFLEIWVLHHHFGYDL